MARRSERGQSVVFFVLIVTCLALLTALVLEVGRLAYARGEVAKCADAAALAAAGRVNVAEYRDSGQVIFLPDVYTFAQDYAGRNSTYLADRSIPVSVTDIRVSEASQVVAVTVSADLSPLLPALLQGGAHVTITGYSQARIDGR
jgi:Flp pilus assembly protein TadG